MSEVTKQGLEDLKKELKYLTTEKRKEIAAAIKHAASFGDLKENASYHEAKEQQAFTEGRISELRAIIASAKVVESQGSGWVELGSTIVLSTGDTYKLVGPAEANVLEGKISYKSPLGELLMKKKVNDKIKLGDIEYIIKEIK